MNEQALCDVEWSCDMHVVWLESRAVTELTPHTWTRSVFDLKLRLNFETQRCGCSLRTTLENGTWISWPDNLDVSMTPLSQEATADRCIYYVEKK